MNWNRRDPSTRAMRSFGMTLGVLLAVAQVATTGASAEPAFRDIAAQVGLDFVHFNGMTGEYYYAEIVGPGVALFDYDRDGDLDVFIPQGKLLGEGKTLEDAVFKPEPRFERGGRLYRNELIPSGELTFSDRTQAAGIEANGYGMGAAVGDYDGDGWLDLYLTNLDANQLLRNNGDGSFSDRTRAAGVSEVRWSAGAVFVDYDSDGDQDLLVINYVDFSISEHKPCFRASSAPDYCGPSSYNPWPDRLFENRGDGTFRDATVASGIGALPGAGLGVSVFDVNGDHRPDLYITNDGMQNFLWINQGDGTFENQAVISGVAVNLHGLAEAGMGVDAGDFDNDGDEDIFIAHLNQETNTLYVNEGGTFTDRTALHGLGPPSLPFTAFGTAWFDYDNDTRLDLFLANGDVKVIEALARAKDPLPIHQRDQLFHNQGRRFVEVKDFETPTRSEVGRGAAFGDVDNDGDTDIVVANNAGPVRLLQNVVGSRSSWIGFSLVDGAGREVVNARVEIKLPSGESLWRRARRDGSYASANDPRVLVGLGDIEEPVEVTVHWPGGTAQAFGKLEAKKYHRLVAGES